MIMGQKFKGRQISVRKVNPAELTPYQRQRAEDARRRANNLMSSSQRLIKAARYDVDGFEASARWYVARCRAGQEQRIAHELTALNIECWCPLKEMRKRRRRGQGADIYLSPVFHGYMFVRLLPFAESFVGALSASRLSGFIGRDGIPYAVPERVINMMKLNVKRKPKDDDDLPIKVNDRVDVKDGPFVGFQATVRSILPKRWRAEVDIEIFGRLSHVELDIDQLTR